MDPVTLHVRPIPAILAECSSLVFACGIPSRVFEGTTLEGLARRCGTLLTESGGEATAVVCYDSSDFQNHPRRVSVIKVVVASADTLVRPGAMSALAAAWKITDALDDRVAEAEGVTDHWRVVSEAALDLKGLSDAAVIVLTVEVEDY